MSTQAAYCRQPAVNAFDNRRDSHGIGQVIKLATLGSAEQHDRYSQTSPFISDVLFTLLRSGGGAGGGAPAAAALCRHVHYTRYLIWLCCLGGGEALLCARDRAQMFVVGLIFNRPPLLVGRLCGKRHHS